VGGDKTRISTLGTLLNFGSSSTELNRTAGFQTQLYIIIQQQTAKRDPTQSPTIAKPCSLCAILAETPARLETKLIFTTFADLF